MADHVIERLAMLFSERLRFIMPRNGSSTTKNEFFMHTPVPQDSEPPGHVTPSHDELLEPVASTQSISLAWYQRDPRPVLWWLAVGLFVVSLVLPINKD